MPLTCREDDCDGAVTMTDSNGATDPSETRWELYECERGHRFSVTLEAQR